jgi:ketosteroid isomerase-like protein
MSRASLTQVSDRERAFAKTMADRDHAAFASFLSDEAVFMSDGQSLRGKQAVAAGWKRFYDAPQARLRLASSRLAGALAKAAPFSWEPDRVEVLDSGSLALSSGPVRDPQGTRVGTFNSVWRREANGAWTIVFDKGCPPCDCR